MKRLSSLSFTSDVDPVSFHPSHDDYFPYRMFILIIFLFICVRGMMTNKNIIKLSSHAERSSTACAACRYYRRRCAENCILAPYFPRHKEQQFINAHKLYGANNIIKTLHSVRPEQREDAITAIIYSADARAQDPVGGCKAILDRLKAQCCIYEAKLHLVRSQIDNFRAAFQMQAQTSEAMPYGSDVIIYPDEDKKPILDSIMNPTSPD